MIPRRLPLIFHRNKPRFTTSTLESSGLTSKQHTPIPLAAQFHHNRPYSSANKHNSEQAVKMPAKDNSQFTRDQLFDLHGKVALVTGGGSGIGLMATQALAVNGAKVYITGRTKSKLDNVVSTYGRNVSGEIIALPGDISTKEGVAALYDEFAQREKFLCILVNNAGISSETMQVESRSGSEMRANLFDDERSTYADWDRTYNTNVTSTFFVTTAFLPLLEESTRHHERWSSAVINMSSISGLIKSAQHHFAYNVSKGAAVHLTRLLAAEIASNGLKIRVNGIAPGVFPSEMTTGASDEDQKSHIPREKYADKVPAGRPGKDEDMAASVLYFATNQYLNGQTLAVDGGYTLAAGQ